MLSLVRLVKFILNLYLERSEDRSHTLVKTCGTVYPTCCALAIMNTLVLCCVIKYIMQQGDGAEVRQLYNKYVRGISPCDWDLKNK